MVETFKITKPKAFRAFQSACRLSKVSRPINILEDRRANERGASA